MWICGDIKDEIGKLRIRAMVDRDRANEQLNRFFNRICVLEKEVRDLRSHYILHESLRQLESDKRARNG